MSDNIFLTGELLRVVPWNCEGIEMPYGYKEHFKMWDPSKQKTYEDLRKKRKITPGTPALVTEKVTDPDSFRSPLYWCIVEGEKLIISHTFLEKMS